MTDKAKRFWEGFALVSAEMLLSLFLFSALVAIVVFIFRRSLRKYKPIDMMIFDKLNPLTGSRNNRIMLFFTLLGKHQFLIPANLALLLFFLFIGKHSWFSVRVAAIALSSLGLMFLLKHLFKRKRPLAPLLMVAKGLSFPSGHAIMAVTFYGLIIYIIFHTINIEWLKWLLTGVLTCLIFLVGFSRIYLRVHYASDVLAGYIIGFIWLIISLNVLSRLEEHQKHKYAPDISPKNILSANINPPSFLNSIVWRDD